MIFLAVDFPYVLTRPYGVSLPDMGTGKSKTLDNLKNERADEYAGCAKAEHTFSYQSMYRLWHIHIQIPLATLTEQDQVTAIWALLKFMYVPSVYTYTKPLKSDYSRRLYTARIFIPVNQGYTTLHTTGRSTQVYKHL